MTFQSKDKFDVLTINGVVKNRGQVILEAMRVERGSTGQLRIKPVAETDHFVIFEAQYGTKTVIAKAFRMTDPEAPFLLDRELKVCRKLRDSGLLPRLICYAKQGRMLFFEKVDQQPISEIVSKDSVLEMARTLGKWSSQFSRKGMARPVSLTWKDFLGRYPEEFPPKYLKKASDLLETLEIRHLVLSKNLLDLSDFALLPNLQLVGQNFGRCAARPVGWDLLLLGRALDAAVPGQRKEIAQALVEGWGTAVGQVKAKKFARLIALFARVTQGLPSGRLSGGPDVFRDLYLRRVPDAKPVQAAYRLPMSRAVLTPPTPEEIDSFKAELTQRAQAAMEIPQDQWMPVEEADKTPPTPLHSAACATCRGSCCKEGLSRHAFLKPPELTWTRTENPEITLEGIVDYYMGFLPQEHVENACLYHGPTGCGLPRKARSIICNTFQCKTLRFMDAEAAAGNVPDGPVLLVGRDDGIHDRVAMYDPRTGREEIDLNG